MFSNALKNKEKNVVGVDITIEEPKNPDIILQNDMKLPITDLAKDLITKINLIKF